MKKRILSIVLAVVMVVGMAATMLTSVSAYTYIDEDSFDVYVSTNALKVDAEMDDVYWQSEQISNAFTYYRQRDGVGFKSWAVATEAGYYAYTEVADTTVGSEYMEWNAKRGNVNDVSAHDKVQYYFQFKYVDGTNWWGYFETDYYANNVDGEQFANINCTSDKTLHHVRWKAAGPNVTAADTNDIPAGVDYATKILRDSNGDEYGWVSEIFIPWNVAGNVPAAQAGTVPTMGIGVQVNNDNYKEGATGDANDRDGYCYSRYVGAGNWWGGDFVNNPLTTLNFSTTSFTKYDVRLTNEYIELDGKLDAAYAGSTMMYNEQGWSGGLKESVPFKGYTVATLNGIYIFAEVEDETMNNITNTNPADGEMVQVYLDWSPLGTAHNDPGVTFDASVTRAYNGVYGSWMGWFQADYDGNLTGSFDTDTQWLRDYGAKVAVEKYENPAWDGQTASEQYTGYAVEFFIPYNDYMQYIVDTQNFADYHFSIGLQVNDDETYDSSENRTSIGYTYGGGSYWSNFEILPEVRLVPDKDLPKHAAGTTVSSIGFDGSNTNGEYDNAPYIYIDLSGSGSADKGAKYRVICDGEYVCAFFEMPNDSTPSYADAMIGNWKDYVDVYYARRGSYQAGIDGSYVGISRTTTGTNYAVVDNKENGWQFEIRWAMTAEEKALFQRGEFMFAVSGQSLDCYTTGSSGRYYKYDNEQGWAFYVGGGNSYAQAFHKFVFAPLVETNVSGASITLGESIAMNYYATLSNNTVDAKLKVTMNDKVTYLAAQPTDKANEYKFTFRGIAPQCMGDNIKAELIHDGKVIETIDNYSVLENLDNIKTESNTSIITELVNYGAAAQVYADYKTDALVNANYPGSVADYLNDNIAANEDRTHGAPLENARFTAVGVYHADANKIYVKLTADDISKVTVKISDLEGNTTDAVIEEYKYENGVYIVYTEDIKVLDFDKLYIFELYYEGVENPQPLTYSVNAYAKAKYQAEDAATANLAKALFAYNFMAELVMGQN